MNEKMTYETIPVPDERLRAAIHSGLRKGEKRKAFRILRNAAAAAAACFFLCFGCANIPSIYAYASEIPLVREFVQALRIGSGGKKQENVFMAVSSSADSLTFSFRTESGAAEKVIPYAVSYHYAPCRLQVSFEGLNSDYAEELAQKAAAVEAVSDVYPVHSADAGRQEFVLVLKRLYNYELMEFSNPGTLTINFYQDAYYTKDEKHPGDIVWLLRTKVLSDRELSALQKEYASYDPQEIRTSDGEKILVIGEYDSEEEAKKAGQKLQQSHRQSVFSPSSSPVEKVPD